MPGSNKQEMTMRIAISSALLAIMLLGGASATFAAESHHHMYKTQPALMNDNAPLGSLHGLAFWRRFN
jgi:hypothetical protein